MELNVIAAVVLGGAQLTGGRGTVIGTVLGVILVVIANNSLILIGVPSVWQLSSSAPSSSSAPASRPSKRGGPGSGVLGWLRQ
ncbi:MAG: hypothetical protein R2838_09905 [Caldilineaceae bacterium]